MFAEKENIVHAGAQLQPAWAGTSKLAPKTPMHQPLKAPKTPFRMPLDRENLETAKKVLPQKKSAFQLDPNAFITPVGPRRVPLGGKTTNAKAPRSEQKEKLQLKLAQSPVTKTVIRDNEDETPDIEYMPPRPIELPDIPDDFIEPDYNLIKYNLFTGAFSAYLDGRDESGKTKLERQLDAIVEEQEKEMIAEANTVAVMLKPVTKKPAATKDKSTTGTSTTSSSRQTSRIRQQTPATSGQTRSTATRAKTPTSQSAAEKKQGSTLSSRPTSRVGTISRCSSKESVTSSCAPSKAEYSRPTSSFVQASHKRSTSTTSSRPASRATTPHSVKSQSVALPKVASGAASSRGNNNSETEGYQPLVARTMKTIEDEAEEALREMIFADRDGPESDKEEVKDIICEEDDIIFQL
ncbi:hypothetical protein BDZ91DRAFT_793343 [Kalaharituber pfeilii]|nr:hypothetical protein BDZ91DRAFT_793343 [Kalaharituber pfeilii]